MAGSDQAAAADRDGCWWATGWQRRRLTVGRVLARLFMARADVPADSSAPSGGASGSGQAVLDGRLPLALCRPRPSAATPSVTSRSPAPAPAAAAADVTCNNETFRGRILSYGIVAHSTSVIGGRKEGVGSMKRRLTYFSVSQPGLKLIFFSSCLVHAKVAEFPPSALRLLALI